MNIAHLFRVSTCVIAAATLSSCSDDLTGLWRGTCERKRDEHQIGIVVEYPSLIKLQFQSADEGKVAGLLSIEGDNIEPGSVEIAGSFIDGSLVFHSDSYGQNYKSLTAFATVENDKIHGTLRLEPTPEAARRGHCIVEAFFNMERE